MDGRKLNKYVGCRYVPMFGGEWDINKSYEPLVIVTKAGASFTSKTFVPVGVDIMDGEFWACTGNYNAQVEQYRQDVKNAIDSFSENINTIVDINKTLLNLRKNIEFLRDKSILIIGDSMSDEKTMPPNWVACLRTLTADINTMIDNKSINGYSLSTIGTTKGMAELLGGFLDIKNDYDYIIFHIGTNDCTGQRPIGEWSSADTTTFYGALNCVNNTLNSHDTRSKIFWVIPPHTNFGGTEYPRPVHLNVYRSVLQSACNRFKFAMIDAYTMLPFFNIYNDTLLNRYSDGLHPNAELAPYLCEFIVEQLRVGGTNHIGDIPTYKQFPTNVDGSNGIIEICYHTNNTYDLRIVVNFENPWYGGYLVASLPSVLHKHFATSFYIMGVGECAMAWNSEDSNFWIALPTDKTVDSISVEIKGIEYYNINPPYQFSY